MEHTHSMQPVLRAKRHGVGWGAGSKQRASGSKGKWNDGTDIVEVMGFNQGVGKGRDAKSCIS